MDRMDIERNGHERPSDNGTAQGREPKKTKRENAKDLKAMTLAELFGALVCSRDEEEIEDIVTEIKKRLDGPLGMQIIVSDEMQQYLAAGLTAVNEMVRELALNQLARCTANEKGLAVLASFLPNIIAALADSSLKVVAAATKALLAMANHPVAKELLFQPESLAQFNQLLSSGNESVRMRVLDVFVEVSAVSPELLTRSAPFLQALIADLRHQDILQSLAIMEFIEKIARTKHGLDYLSQAGVLDMLRGLLANMSDPSASFLCGNILRFVAYIARKGGEEARLVFPFIDTIKRHLAGDDETSIEASITAVGAIGSTTEGLSELLAHHVPVLREWLEYLTSTNTLLRLSCLHAFAELLTCRDDDRTKAAYDLEDKGWNGSQMGEATRTLMKYLNQPFQELRYAAFRVATSVALHPWGVRALFSSPGFHEFLLNRNTESSKTGLEHKYALVRAVLACDEAHPDAALLPTERRQQLRSYQAQGTFFVLPEYVTKIADQSA